MDTGFIMFVVILAVALISALVGADLSWRNADEKRFYDRLILMASLSSLAPGLALILMGSWSYALNMILAIIGGFTSVVAYVLAALAVNTEYKILWRK